MHTKNGNKKKASRDREPCIISLVSGLASDFRFFSPHQLPPIVVRITVCKSSLPTGSLLLSEFLGPASSSSTSLFPLCLPRHHFLPSPSTPHRLKLSALALSSLLSIEYPSISSRIVFKQQHPSLGAGVFLGLLPWFVVSILEAYQERKRLDQQGPPSLLRSTLPELSTLALFFFFFLSPIRSLSFLDSTCCSKNKFSRIRSFIHSRIYRYSNYRYLFILRNLLPLASSAFSLAS